MKLEIEVPEAADMEALGARLAPNIAKVQLVYLHGELGTGKTTLVRGLLHALGHVGVVKSPTFTLVEPYSVGGQNTYHFDLYRLKDPSELEFVGFRDYLRDSNVCLVEWAERAAEVLPMPDIDVIIHKADHRRIVHLMSRSNRGADLLTDLS